MGWSKYTEDNRIISEERCYFLDNDNKVKYVIPITYSCPYCDRTFNNKEDLYMHIKKSHNVIHPIFIINGKVISNYMDHYVTSIESSIIYLYGYNDQIIINGEVISTIDNDKIDVTNILQEALNKRNDVIITVGKSKFSIIKYSRESLNNEKVMRIINEWSFKTEKKETIYKNYTPDLNGSEIRFLDGFYNYFLACNAKYTDKKKRYDDAYAILNSFNPNTSIGLCALKIIAFRRNCVRQLNELCIDDDSFKIANCFFRNEMFVNNYEATGAQGELFIEDDIKDNLDAIASFVNKDFDSVRNYINKNQLVDVIEDSNLRDRIYLLRARLALADNDKVKALREYKKIHTEDFIKEINNI